MTVSISLGGSGEGPSELCDSGLQGMNCSLQTRLGGLSLGGDGELSAHHEGERPARANWSAHLQPSGPCVRQTYFIQSSEHTVKYKHLNILLSSASDLFNSIGWGNPRSGSAALLQSFPQSFIHQPLINYFSAPTLHVRCHFRDSKAYGKILAHGGRSLFQVTGQPRGRRAFCLRDRIPVGSTVKALWILLCNF